MKSILVLLFSLVCGCCSLAIADQGAGQLIPLAKDTRCPVCGMFVGKYQQWLTQVKLSDGTGATFDGVKDMAAYIFAPVDFGAPRNATVGEVAVRDYYTQNWTDGRQAFYVLGSDILGPMGHELVPLQTRDKAETFAKDHHGTRVLGFSEITPELIASLRKGHEMKGHGKAGMK